MSIFNCVRNIVRQEICETFLFSNRYSTKFRLCSTNATETDPVKEADVESVPSNRVEIIPLETSLRYMKSKAFKETYGDKAVWVQYRRNHKGQLPPRKTRESCIRFGVMNTGNPCPICRDKYLVLHEKNVDLLKHFISEHTGQTLSYSKTGICQKRHKELLISINRAKDQGLITFDVPFREYDYSEYLPKTQ